MQVNFMTRENGPERLVAEAEILFGAEAGPLSGLKLVGFSLWQSPEGDVYVTFPSRGFGAGAERRYFDYLRASDPDDRQAAKGLKAWIVAEHAKWRQAAA